MLRKTRPTLKVGPERTRQSLFQSRSRSRSSAGPCRQSSGGILDITSDNRACFFVAPHTVEALLASALLHLFRTSGVDSTVFARVSVSEGTWRDLQLLTTELFQRVFHFLCRLRERRIPGASSPGGKRWPRRNFVTWVAGDSEAPTALLRTSCWPCLVLCLGSRSTPGTLPVSDPRPALSNREVVAGQPTKERASKYVVCAFAATPAEASVERCSPMDEAWRAAKHALSCSAVRILAATVSAKAPISSARQNQKRTQAVA